MIRRLLAIALPLSLFVAGCHTDMWTQPQTRALEPSPVFPDGKSARTPPKGTVAFRPSGGSASFDTGEGVAVVPVDETERALGLRSLDEVLRRGQEKFDIFCSPCHGRLGDGNGMIAQRGLALAMQPRNFHRERIVNATDGHIFQVITHGYRYMFSYEDRIAVPDRWAIVAYIRALQLSENAGDAHAG